jgi:intein/homing endonuclease
MKEKNHNEVNFEKHWIETVDQSEWNIYSDTDSSVGSNLIVTKDRKEVIENLYNQINQKPLKTKDVKGYLVDAKFPEDLKVLSFNTSLKIPEFKKVKSIWKYKVKRKLYKLKVQDKEIICTENHSIFVRRNNEIIKIKLKDLKHGDEIILIKERNDNG